MVNYLNCAKENDLVFRAILKSLGYSTDTLTVDEIYTEYSEGQRMCRFTVIDFEKKDSFEYELTYSNTGPLSGLTITGLWSYMDNELKFIKNVNILMS